MTMKKLFIATIITTLALAQQVAQAEDLNASLDSLRRVYAPDSRVAIWEVTATQCDDGWTISGKVDNSNFKSLITEYSTQVGIQFTDSITVLEGLCSTPWALVKLSVASMRTAPRHSAEMATQAVMGTPLRLLEEVGDWVRAQSPDGYISYVPANSLTPVSEDRIMQWKNAKRYIVTTYSGTLYEAPGSNATVSDLVLGDILEYQATSGDSLLLITPDGRHGYVPTTDVADLSLWAMQQFNADLIESTAKRMMGSGYLWGGTSTKVTDCSGLAKVCYFANAIILQRDASQQALYGLKIPADQWQTANTGDLLFFGSASGRVTHVGIYLRDGLYIHCSGQVKINSLDPTKPNYLSTPLLSISRIDTQISTAGITAVREHPWYFNL